MQNKAQDYYKQGYSCSESVVKAAIEEGLISKEFLTVATSFSGGMSSGCLCGAVAGAQMVIGGLYGRNDSDRNGQKAREAAKKFVEEFKAKNKATCCKVLTAGLEFSSPERKANCAKLVGECSVILDNILGVDKEAVL